MDLICVYIMNYSRTCLERPPHGHKNVACQDRWSLVTGSAILKCLSFWQKCVVFQARWFLKTGFTVVGCSSYCNLPPSAAYQLLGKSSWPCVVLLSWLWSVWLPLHVAFVCVVLLPRRQSSRGQARTYQIHEKMWNTKLSWVRLCPNLTISMLVTERKTMILYCIQSSICTQHNDFYMHVYMHVY